MLKNGRNGRICKQIFPISIKKQYICCDSQVRMPFFGCGRCRQKDSQRRAELQSLDLETEREKPVIAGNGREESTDILKAFTQTLRLRRVESCKFKPIKVLNRGGGRCPGCGLYTINMVKVRIYCTLNGRIISLLKPY